MKANHSHLDPALVALCEGAGDVAVLDCFAPENEPAPTISDAYLRDGDPGEVVLGIAYGYRSLLEDVDLNRGMIAVATLALYAGHMRQTPMSAADFTALAQSARQFAGSATNPKNRALTDYVLLHAEDRARTQRLI